MPQLTTDVACLKKDCYIHFINFLPIAVLPLKIKVCVNLPMTLLATEVLRIDCLLYLVRNLSILPAAVLLLKFKVCVNLQ